MQRALYLNGVALVEGQGNDFTYEGQGRFRFAFDLRAGTRPDVITIPYVVGGQVRGLTHVVLAHTHALTQVQVFDPSKPLPEGFQGF